MSCVDPKEYVSACCKQRINIDRSSVTVEEGQDEIGVYTKRSYNMHCSECGQLCKAYDVFNPPRKEMAYDDWADLAKKILCFRNY